MRARNDTFYQYKMSRMRTVKKLVSILLIHGLHISWIALIWIKINNGATFEIDKNIAGIWVVAFSLEVFRWDFLGKGTFKVGGAYSYARAIEAAHEKFFLFSPYIIPPLPPFKVLEETSKGLFKEERNMELRVVFSKFWLSKKILPVALLIIYLLSYGVVKADSPKFGGLINLSVVSFGYWVFSMGLLGKLIFTFIYSLFIKAKGV